jgi:hypothetical protein
MNQLVSPGELLVTPNLSFGKAYDLEDMGLSDSRDTDKITQAIIKEALDQFKIHEANFLAA